MRVTNLIIRQSIREPAQSPGHLRKPLSLHQVVKCEWREHSTISVHVRLYQQRRASYSVKRHLRINILPLLELIGHQCSVRWHLSVSLNEDVVWAHCLGKLPRLFAVLPGVEVVGALVGLLGIGVDEALEAVGYDDRLVMQRKVLDQRRRCLNDICVQPEDPRGGWAKGGEEERVPRPAHSCAADLLMLQLVPFSFILRRQWRREILALNDD